MSQEKLYNVHVERNLLIPLSDGAELAASMVVVETRSWITQAGMTLSGRVTLDGRLFFDKQWQK